MDINCCLRFITGRGGRACHDSFSRLLRLVRRGGPRPSRASSLAQPPITNRFDYTQLVSVFLRDAMTVEEFLASACSRKGLNPMEHFVRVKKRRDMEDHNYFVPHRTDGIDTYVSEFNFSVRFDSIFFKSIIVN